MFALYLQTVLEAGERVGGFPAPAGDPLETKALIEQARVRLAETCGSVPDGLVLLDHDLRITLCDAIATGLLGPEPGSVLRSQVFSAFSKSDQPALQAALDPSARPVVAQSSTKSGKNFGWAIAHLEDKPVVGFWIQKPILSAPPELTSGPGLLSLNSELSLCTTLGQVAAKLTDQGQNRLGAGGFVFVPDRDELSVLAVWPSGSGAVGLMRFPIECSQAAMFGAPVFCDAGCQAEPYVSSTATVWIVPVSVFGRLACLVGLEADRMTAETFGAMLGPHLARISRAI